jgi:glycosyltransferase involved in cell wall biosynthesis
VRFLGRVSADELARALLEHDILVLSSRQEGFGIVVSEAMHAGLPVVSTRCGGPEQVVRQSGGGILVDHTAAAFVDAIRILAGDPTLLAAMGARGRDYAQRELSAERFAKRVADELKLLRAAASIA